MEELTEEEQMALAEEMQDMQSDQADDQYENVQELQELYDAPTPEEKQNAHSFLHKAAFDNLNTVRTTFLTESELGRPLFSVRFLLDMEDISKHYLDPLVKKFGGENRISIYFLEKIYNITNSGMSNKGFSMNLNVTRKMQSTRTKVKNRDIPPQLKGGKTR